MSAETNDSGLRVATDQPGIVALCGSRATDSVRRADGGELRQPEFGAKPSSSKGMRRRQRFTSWRRAHLAAGRWGGGDSSA
jgi:hypothetical protein